MIPICPDRFTESLQVMGIVVAFPSIPLGAFKWLCKKNPACLQRWNGITLTAVLTLGFKGTHPCLSVDHSLPLPLYSRKLECLSLLAILTQSSFSRGIAYHGDFNVLPGLSLVQGSMPFAVRDFNSTPHWCFCSPENGGFSGSNTGIGEWVKIEHEFITPRLGLAGPAQSVSSWTVSSFVVLKWGWLFLVLPDCAIGSGSGGINGFLWAERCKCALWTWACV